MPFYEVLYSNGGSVEVEAQFRSAEAFKSEIDNAKKRGLSTMLFHHTEINPSLVTEVVKIKD